MITLMMMIIIIIIMIIMGFSNGHSTSLLFLPTVSRLNWNLEWVQRIAQIHNKNGKCFLLMAIVELL